MKRGVKAEMSNIKRTVLFTIGISLVTIVFVVLMQVRAQSGLVPNASYLDPILIDVLAFSVAVFLVIDGIYRIWEHKNASLKTQFTRTIRVAIGVSILTVHLIQISYKALFT